MVAELVPPALSTFPSWPARARNPIKATSMEELQSSLSSLAALVAKLAEGMAARDAPPATAMVPQPPRQGVGLGEKYFSRLTVFEGEASVTPARRDWSFQLRAAIKQQRRLDWSS